MFIVSLPYSVQQGGYWGIFALVFVAYICCHTGKILVECLYEHNDRGELVRVRDSYVSIAKVCLGSKWGSRSVHFAQVNLDYCYFIYILFIHTNVSTLINHDYMRILTK